MTCSYTVLYFKSVLCKMFHYWLRSVLRKLTIIHGIQSVYCCVSVLLETF